MGESGAHISNIDSKPVQDTSPAVWGADIGEDLRRIRGVGDAFAALTAALGIPHCGECEARRQKWNRLFRAAHADHPLDGYLLSRGGTGGVH